ncbi:MAG: hypothetical protein FWC41_14100 [Firmicutes bacterium]|nr:hypothetical protein [Bacillota bacterium]
MQFIKNINGVTPIAVASLMSLGIMDGAMAYNAIDTCSNINTVVTNPIIASYIKNNEDLTFFNLQIKHYFNELVSNWKHNTMFSSSVQQIINDSNFQKIVSLKEKAVPLILLEIQNQPSMMVWALNLIYGTKVSNNPNLTVTEACKLWVKKLHK